VEKGRRVSQLNNHLTSINSRSTSPEAWHLVGIGTVEDGRAQAEMGAVDHRGRSGWV